MKISIFVINYNNAKLLQRSISSAQNQNYKNKEIIVFDDCSNDGSDKIINKNKNIIKIFNKKKLVSGCQSQISGIKKCLDKCSGDIICFLDSDDFFKKNKLKEVEKFYKKNPKAQVATDKAIFFFNKSKNFNIKGKINIPRFFTWPKFSPHSCLTMTKKFLEKNFEDISVKSFDSVWIDFRILILCYIKYQKVYLIDKFLTFYQQKNDSVTSGYKKYNKIWWIRRNEAHNYIYFLNKKNKTNIKFLIDNILTKIMYRIFQLLKF